MGGSLPGDVSGVIFREELAIPKPDHHLEVGSGTHTEQTARIMMAFEKVLHGLESARRHADLPAARGDRVRGPAESRHAACEMIH
jgi:UDP-N-acetylglucosamine 2-epimerase